MMPYAEYDLGGGGLFFSGFFGWSFLCFFVGVFFGVFCVYLAFFLVCFEMGGGGCVWILSL